MIKLNTTKKIVVILGAGASYDSFNSNTNNVKSAWWPPLAEHLFGDFPEDDHYAERIESFLPVLERYSGAQAVAAYLAPFYRNQDFSLEAKLL